MLVWQGLQSLKQKERERDLRDRVSKRVRTNRERLPWPLDCSTVNTSLPLSLSFSLSLSLFWSSLFLFTRTSRACLIFYLFSSGRAIKVPRNHSPSTSEHPLPTHPKSCSQSISANAPDGRSMLVLLQGPSICLPPNQSREGGKRSASVTSNCRITVQTHSHSLPLSFSCSLVFNTKTFHSTNPNTNYLSQASLLTLHIQPLTTLPNLCFLSNITINIPL